MKLNEICEVYSGYALKSFNDIEDGVPVVKIGNILTDGTLDLEECQFTTDSVNEKYYSNKGDIYIALSGATTGKIGIMDKDEKYIINQRVGIVRKKSDDIPQEYIKYFLLRQTDRILQEAAGCAQPNISPKQIAEYMVPDTSKEKMQEICDILDKTKKIIDSRKTELSSLDDLIKARFVELFGNCEEKRKLDDYAELITKGASPRWQGVEYSDKEEGTLFVTSENVRKGYIDYSKKKYLPNEINNILPRSVLKRNDILINIVNASIGRAAIYENDALANINQAVALVRLKPNALNLQFLLAFLNSDEAIRAYDYMKVGGDKANLSLKNISDLLIPVADISIQNKFADFVKQVDKSKIVVQKALGKAQLLFDNLMQEYFG